MKPIDIFISNSTKNQYLEKVATLTQENLLVYNDDSSSGSPRVTTLIKFATITATSPLIAVIRLVRSVVFLIQGDLSSGGREFLGGMGVPVVASTCFVGTLLFSVVDQISGQSYYTLLRRTYAYFEAWINHIDLKAQNLPSYSSRVSSPEEFHHRIWTTAPCMQPLLEKGESSSGGLFDAARMQKIFPRIHVKDIHREGDEIVIGSQCQGI